MFFRQFLWKTGDARCCPSMVRTVNFQWSKVANRPIFLGASAPRHNADFDPVRLNQP